jgi:hypothetical protein
MRPYRDSVEEMMGPLPVDFALLLGGRSMNWVTINIAHIERIMPAAQRTAYNA